MKKFKTIDIILLVLLVVCIASVIVFSLPDLSVSGDEKTDALIADTVPRLMAGLFLLAVMVAVGYGRALTPALSTLPQALLWCVPCLLVAVVNFPFSALIRGDAVIARTDLIWLFAVKCVAIGLLEEMFFRGLLLPIVLEKLKGKYRVVSAIVLSSAIFGVVHLFNLFFGAGAGATFLQAGYSFLIGCMLAVTVLRTRNLWLCVLLHALFDFGGTIVTELGGGAFQDAVFWILTALAAVLCAAHCIYTLKFIKDRHSFTE